MNRDLLVLLWAPAGRRGGWSRAVRETFPLLGKPSLSIILDSVSALKPEKILYLGESGGDDLRAVLEPAGVETVLLDRNRGTSAAVLAAAPRLVGSRPADVLLLDTRFPLLGSVTLRALRNRHRRQQNSLTALAGGGEIPAIAACGQSFYAAARAARRSSGGRDDLSDLLRAAEKKGKRIGFYPAPRPEEIFSVQSAAAVSRAVRLLGARKIQRLQDAGVIVVDPVSAWIDLDARVGRGTVLYPAVVIEGRSSIGRDCRVYPFVHIIDTRVGDGVRILSSTVVEGSRIGPAARVGPFSRFRPGTVIQAKARIGNFVEMKNTVFGEGSKAGHLSYLGDAVIGPEVNIGAGTITCNYDGFKKSRTVIEKGAFIGSGTELVAPVRVGRGAYIGAGSTITEDVSAEALAVCRVRQVEKPGWARRRSKK